MEEMISDMECSYPDTYTPPYDYCPRNLEKHYTTECRLRTDRNINTFDENMKGFKVLLYSISKASGVRLKVDFWQKQSVEFFACVCVPYHIWPISFQNKSK